MDQPDTSVIMRLGQPEPAIEGMADSLRTFANRRN